MRQINVKSFVKVPFYFEEFRETEFLVTILMTTTMLFMGADDVLLGAVQGRSKVVHKGGGGWRRSALGSGAPLDVNIKWP